MSTVNRWLPWLAGAGVLLTLCVMGLGAFTRLMDAGLGCPDWPGCYGHWVLPKTVQVPARLWHTPLDTQKAWVEMIHRYVAGLLGMVTLAVFLGLVYLRVYSRVRVTLSSALPNACYTSNKTYGRLAAGLFLLVIYQIALGRWTVTWHLLPIIVTQHLLGAMGILSVLWLTVLATAVGAHNPGLLSHRAEPTERTARKGLLKIHEGYRREALPGWITWLPFLGLILLLLQIFLGAWTSTHYASLSCTDFPFCHNEGPWFPIQFTRAFHISTLTQLNYEGGTLPEAARQTIHMTHRAGAVLLSAYLLFMGSLLFTHVTQSRLLFTATLCTLGVLLVQIALGIANVVFQLPLVSAVAHTLTAGLLLLCLVTLCYGVTALPQGYRHG